MATVYKTTIHVYKESDVNRSYSDYVHIKDIAMVISQGPWFGTGLGSQDRIVTAIKTALGINNDIQVEVFSNDTLDKPIANYDDIAPHYFVVLK
ncbi:hypothetical protein ABK040_016311 [Willaertia magna]